MTPGRDETDGPQDPDPTREIRRGDDEEEAPFVGQTLGGRYRVEAHLGEGAMGAVYLAEHVRIGRRDAIKLLNPDLADDEDAWARFTREARNASHINHPNVCTVYDFGETDEGLPFIAMEYVEGETLSDLMEREGPLPPERVLELAEQILDALSAAHDRGIVHRDLKPENIMLSRDEHGSDEDDPGTVKVVDFGIAKAVQDEEGGQDITRQGFAVGTPRYVSPEQVSGGDLDQRSDLYALGIVLYEMLTGRLPFTGGGWREVMTKRLSEEPTPLGAAAPDLDVGVELERVIHRALSREPEDRYEDAEAMRRALREAIRGEGKGTAALPGTEHIDVTGGGPALLDPSAWPEPWRRAALAALVVAGLGGAAWAGMSALGGGDAGTEASESGADPAAEQVARAGEAGGNATAGGATGGSSDGDGGTNGGGTGDAGAAGGGSDGDGADGPADASADGGDEPAAEDAAAEGGGGAETGGGQAGGEATEPADAPTGGGDGAGAAEEAEEAAAETGGGGAEAGGEADASPLAGRSAAGVDSLLFRQLARLDPGGGTAPAVLRAVDDTAELVWEASGQTDSNRGFAAYLRARVRQERGELGPAETWAERAVELDPDGTGFQTLLESLRGGGP